jgi:peptide/nickel transport system substrate-binding protein
LTKLKYELYYNANDINSIKKGEKEEMGKKIIWMVVSCLMVLSLVIASCGGGEVEEKEKVTAEAPKYGGTLTLALIEEPRWDIISFGGSWPVEQAHQRMVDGNWAKGPAGGYGESLTTWGTSTNIPDFNTGYLATDQTFEVSSNGTEVTTTFTIREGVHYALFDSEASQMVGGREMTVDDCVWSWNQPIKNENAQNWQLYPNVRYPTAVKTGPNSFEITHKYEDHIDAMMRENLCCRVMPPEVWDAYGYESCTNWEYSVGTGPFMVTDYVVGNLVVMERNPNYWMKDPVGPGKGNQLPYVDTFKYIIIQDASTRQAALRTGQVDQMGGFNLEDKDQMLKTAPELITAPRGKWRTNPIFMKTDQAPYNDVRVRRAMLMATNFNDINESLYQGLGDIISWPYFDVEGYEPLYVSVDDPDCTDLIKELYGYNPEKAKALLTEAGYPNGFKAKLSLIQDAIDYYSVIQDMWAQVGIELEMEVLPDNGALMSAAFNISYELIALGTSPNSSYPEQSLYAVRNWVNASLINEPYVDETAKAVKSLAITDFQASMELCRPLCIYLIEQAYCVPAPFYPTHAMWWPWLKNYTGEDFIGYWGKDHWTHYIWIDQDLKASMGY